MVPFLTAVWLLQASCAGEAARHVATADARAEAFDTGGAADAYFVAAALGCSAAEIAAHYLRGLVAAREAYRYGGSPESLEPVTQAIAALDARGATRRGAAEVARFVLLAAAAASQSERDTLAVHIDHALQLEMVQLEAGQRGAPGISAHEVAGDLFLQVHRYEDARRYYTRAVERLGRATPRVALGLARAAARLGETESACAHYRTVIAWWGSRSGESAELAEARSVVDDPACQPPPRR